MTAPRTTRFLTGSISLLTPLIFIPSLAVAADSTWVGGTSTDWNDVTNWTAGLATDNAFVNTIPANIATITANPTVTQKDIFVGNGGNTGQINHTAGTVSSSGTNWMFIGQGGTGTYNLADTTASGGTLTGFGTGAGSLTNWGRIYVGQDGGGNGKLNINTSGSIAVANDINVAVGGATGVVKMDAGTINQTGGWTAIGRDAGGNGTFSMSGGTVTSTVTWLVGTAGAQGLFNMSAGTGAPASFSTAGEFWVGDGGGGTGTMTVSEGTASVGNWFAIGRSGATGTLTISGNGTVQKTNTIGSLELTNSGSVTASGTVNLNGGNLIVNDITGSGGVGSTANFYFHGGTLKPTVANANFINGNVVPIVKAGGAIIDTNGQIIAINSALVTDLVSTGGGLTKNGLGSLTLGATSTYTGATTVNNGTLLVNGDISASSSVAVNGGTLGGTGTVGGTSVNVGGTLAPGASIGELNFTSSLTLAGISEFEINKTGVTLTSDLADILAGTVTFGGTLNVTASGDPLAPGDFFDLFNAPLFAGSFATLNLPALDPGYSWETSNLGTDGTISVVPEPTALGLLSLAALGLAARRRRK